MAGAMVTARATQRKIMRRVRWLVLFQVRGMYENSAMVAIIMMNTDTAPPSAEVVVSCAVVGTACVYALGALYLRVGENVS